MDDESTSSSLYATVTACKEPVPEEAQHLRHHLKGGRGFTNPWDSWKDMSAPRIMKEILWRRLTGASNNPDTKAPTVPVRRPNFLASRKTQTIRATWLGHACYYVQFPGGLSVLFDPVFTTRCSPFSWLGPKRYTEAPCKISDIPIIDAVVISHNHYDHLSYETIVDIKNRHPGVHFFAPLGNKKWFTDSGIKDMTELDWWESRNLRISPKENEEEAYAADHGVDKSRTNDSRDIAGIFGCLPCQHASARTPFDKSRTLWASWSVESGGKKVWFGGDTGYRAVPKLPPSEDDYSATHQYPHCPAFSQIGKLRGPFDLGLIPIGAYDPRFLFSPMHANPKDAVNIFVDTKCKKAMGIHWGTWVLTEEDVMEPPKLLKEALSEKGLPETGIFDVCEIGECREF